MLRMAVVIADDAAAASWYASKVNFEISRPTVRVVVRRRQREQLVDQLAAQVEHDAVPVHAMPYSETKEPRPRSRNTATIASGSHIVVCRIRVLELLDDRHDHVGHDQSPAATIIMPTTASANAHQ